MCGFWAGGNNGLLFFENATGQAKTVNCACARAMINQFFVPKLQDMNVNNMWFQRDSAVLYKSQKTMQLLHESFPGSIISRFDS